MNRIILTCKYFAVIILILIPPELIYSSGHGPVYALATPTLGRGEVSFDAAFMTLRQEDGSSPMLKYLWGYGITERVQFAISTHSPIDSAPQPARTRGSSMMQGNGDIEGFIYWRFYSNAFDIGKRFDITTYLSGTIPTEDTRGGVKVGNSLHAALVAGYASRTLYFWLGGGYQYYFEKNNDRLGELPYMTAAFGYRPPLFKRDYPRPDWRIFIESKAEFPGRNISGGDPEMNTGGTKYLVGPTVLGLYGAWGISGGFLFPLYQDLNGAQPEENFRFMVNLTYWIH